MTLIGLHRINAHSHPDSPVFIAAEHIQSIEPGGAGLQTRILMTSGDVYSVREAPATVIGYLTAVTMVKNPGILDVPPHPLQPVSSVADWAKEMGRAE